MRVLFVQQDHVSPVGPVGAAFASRGYDLELLTVVPVERHRRPDVSVRFPDATDFDAIVAMGAPWSVYDRATIGTWIDDELAFLRAAITAEVPVLGICFGAQALAAALGGRVTAADRPEIGWTAVRTERPDIVGEGPWFEWHGDRWHLPAGTIPIASTTVCDQAFVYGRSLGVQFHPEITPAQLDGWLENGGDEHAAALGVDVERLRADTAHHADAAAQRTDALVAAFLDLPGDGARRA